MRIAIVNDSSMAVEVMRRTIEATAFHQVAWLARDGDEAVAACARDTPDLILMDLMMPRMDGVEATRRIMAETPCIILIVTASVNGRAGKVFEALGAGALDAVTTPVLGGANGARALLAKIETMGRLLGSEKHDRNPRESGLRHSNSSNDLVVIGASAGGPAALGVILSELPRDFSAAIVIVQHVDAQFASGMAKWLNDQSVLPVRLALEGDKPKPGEVLLAGKDEHLIFKLTNSVGYIPDSSNRSSVPSVDVFFQSVIGNWQGSVTALLLTGMGRDGAAGLKALRESGAHTIAQDKASSVVYGMPKAAVELKAAVQVLPLHEIAMALSRTGPLASLR